MQRKSKVLSGLMAVVIGVSLVTGGCSVQRKPEDVGRDTRIDTVPGQNYATPGANLPGPNAAAPAPTPAPLVPGPNRVPNPARVAPTPENERVARDAADDVADKIGGIAGVERAYVVVVGNVAMVGLDLDRNVEKADTERIREKAASMAKADRRIVRTVVETDPDVVKRISNMATGVREGRPISEFFDQITEIFNRTKPTT